MRSTVIDQQVAQSSLKAAASRWGVPGAVLALSKGDRTDVYCHGVLNTDTGERVQTDSMFQVGSISKVWTASLVMRLVDQGCIDLDATVRTYLPDFRTSDVEMAKAVTVRQLLCHSSGLDGDFMTDTGTGDDRLARFVDRCALLPHIFAPGEDFSYSNSAYKLAGRIVEVCSGLPFDVALRRHLIDPLGLTNAVSEVSLLVGRSVSSGHSPPSDNAAAPTRIPTLYTLPISGAPAGSTLMTSAQDLIAFARMHLNGGKAANASTVLTEQSVKQMQTLHSRVPVPARDIDAWGLGWMFLDYAGKRIYGHDGATVGQSAYLRIDPATDTVAVLFANGGHANDFMMEVFAETFDVLADFKPTPPDSTIDVDDVSGFVGRYRNVSGDTEISERNGVLYHKASFRVDDLHIPQPEARLEHVGDDRFVWCSPGQKYPAMISFRDRNADGIPQRTFSGLRYRNRVCTA